MQLRLRQTNIVSCDDDDDHDDSENNTDVICLLIFFLQLQTIDNKLLTIR